MDDAGYVAGAIPVQQLKDAPRIGDLDRPHTFGRSHAAHPGSRVCVRQLDHDVGVNGRCGSRSDNRVDMPLSDVGNVNHVINTVAGENLSDRPAQHAWLDEDCHGPHERHIESKRLCSTLRIPCFKEFMGDPRPRVFVVDDHDLMAEALQLALRARGFDAVESAKDLSVEAAVKSAEQFGADVVLLDLVLGRDATSIPMITPLIGTGARVLMLTGSRDSRLLAECIEAGASGIFDKGQSFEQLIEFIEDAVLGRTLLSETARAALLSVLRDHRSQEQARALPFSTLSQREREVLRLLMMGRSARDVAAEMFVSLTTVRTHVRAILRKLGVNSQLAAVVLAERAGWSDEDSAGV